MFELKGDCQSTYKEILGQIFWSAQEPSMAIETSLFNGHFSSYEQMKQVSARSWRKLYFLESDKILRLQRNRLFGTITLPKELLECFHSRLGLRMKKR